ncbi:15890_t:CDS:1 [Acaulospora colombiana]|uniref:15890_t:CDS:1 n=1 Tax=Acaulospora colombiana TaxID=27376 RepID=A0ACA9M248_9GLOM|nr:15890_t:CDS:1 [Acaulospora colombiana]
MSISLDSLAMVSPSNLTQGKGKVYPPDIFKDCMQVIDKIAKQIKPKYLNSDITIVAEGVWKKIISQKEKTNNDKLISICKNWYRYDLDSNTIKDKLSFIVTNIIDILSEKTKILDAFSEENGNIETLKNKVLKDGTIEKKTKEGGYQKNKRRQSTPSEDGQNKRTKIQTNAVTTPQQFIKDYFAILKTINARTSDTELSTEKAINTWNTITMTGGHDFKEYYNRERDGTCNEVVAANRLTLRKVIDALIDHKLIRIPNGEDQQEYIDNIIECVINYSTSSSSSSSSFDNFNNNVEPITSMTSTPPTSQQIMLPSINSFPSLPKAYPTTTDLGQFTISSNSNSLMQLSIPRTTESNNLITQKTQELQYLVTKMTEMQQQLNNMRQQSTRLQNEISQIVATQEDELNKQKAAIVQLQQQLKKLEAVSK